MSINTIQQTRNGLYVDCINICVFTHMFGRLTTSTLAAVIAVAPKQGHHHVAAVRMNSIASRGRSRYSLRSNSHTSRTTGTVWCRHFIRDPPPFPVAAWFSAEQWPQSDAENISIRNSNINITIERAHSNALQTTQPLANCESNFARNRRCSSRMQYHRARTRYIFHAHTCLYFCVFVHAGRAHERTLAVRARRSHASGTKRQTSSQCRFISVCRKNKKKQQAYTQPDSRLQAQGALYGTHNVGTSIHKYSWTHATRNTRRCAP